MDDAALPEGHRGRRPAPSRRRRSIPPCTTNVSARCHGSAHDRPSRLPWTAQLEARSKHDGASGDHTRTTVRDPLFPQPPPDGRVSVRRAHFFAPSRAFFSVIGQCLGGCSTNEGNKAVARSNRSTVVPDFGTGRLTAYAAPRTLCIRLEPAEAAGAARHSRFWRAVSSCTGACGASVAGVPVERPS